MTNASAPPQGDIHRADEALTQALLADRLHVATTIEKGIDDRRVPLATPTLAENLVDLHEAKPLAVRPVARHCVEGIGDRENPGLVGDCLTGESVGVTGPVVAFMVMSHAGQDVVQFLEVLEN